MRVTRLRLRDFRSYARAEIALGPGLTVVTGRNGAGKTNLLEALYFGLTGRSCRTSSEREVVRFGAGVTRIEVDLAGPDGDHALTVGFAHGEPKRFTADGAPVERLVDVPFRPLAVVFLPERLELVKGTPSVRRGHLDQLVAALMPARAGVRADYLRALGQRNALLGRIRAGGASRTALSAWDRELARQGIALMALRREAIERVAPEFEGRATDLGLEGEPSVAYRPRSAATDAEALAAELAERTDGDVERGFTGHGPHRDDLLLRRDDRELRTYGSQGQQRLGVLALLLAEREVLARARSAPPVMLLDDVMSELDADRRTLLVDRLRSDGGQALVTTTDLAHVPGGDGDDVRHVEVRDGEVLTEATA